MNRISGGQFHGPLVQAGTVHLTVDGRGPAAPVPLIPVRDADPVRLGVHRSIRAEGGSGPALPPYVPRDYDTRLRALVRSGNGFVLLVGGSSVGKTRSLYEALRAELPDRPLAHPAGPGELTELARSAPGRLVVWLDELQNHAVTASTLRELAGPGREVLLAGTLWPHLYDAWSATPTSTEDRHRTERELLKQAEVLRVSGHFTAAERERAGEAAVADARLRIALDSADFGLTQVIAAAPQLVHRWEAADPYAGAVLAAAIDATRLGAHSPVPAALLRAAAAGYCGPAQRAGAPSDWFERALEYVTQPQLGATAPLVAVTEGLRMGVPDGYRVADYLAHHVGRARRAVPPPQVFWDACAEHLTDPADLQRLGGAAVERQRLAAGLPLLRGAAEAGNLEAAREAAELCRRMDDLAGFREMTDRLRHSADDEAARQLALLASPDLETLLRLVERGNRHALGQVAEVADPRPAIALLSRYLRPDDLELWDVLAQLLCGEGDHERAVPVLEMLLERNYRGDDLLVDSLCEALAHTGRTRRLRELAAEGHFPAFRSLALLLDEQGDTDGALALLRGFAGRGGESRDELLVFLLAEHRMLEELLLRADAGDPYAALRAARLLEEEGDEGRAVEVLRPHADAGDDFTAGLLAGLLARGGCIAELRDRMAGGDRRAATVLAERLTAEGELEEAIRVSRAGNRSMLLPGIVRALESRGRTDLAVRYLEEETDAGDWFAAHRLAGLLKKHGRSDGLRKLVDQGEARAAELWCELLGEQGRGAEARRIARYGLTADGRVAEGG